MMNGNEDNETGDGMTNMMMGEGMMMNGGNMSMLPFKMGNGDANDMDIS